MRDRRRTTLFLAALGLVGCATTASAPDGARVKPSQGVLALNLSSNAKGFLSFVPYDEKSYSARMSEDYFGPKGTIEIVEGERYLILPLDVGEYMWSRVTLNHKVGSLFSTTHFTVRPGVIVYIGHIRIVAGDTKFNIGSVDREDDMRAHLKANFPVYSQSMPFEKLLAEFHLGPGRLPNARFGGGP